MEKEQNQKTEDNTQIKNKDDEVINETSNNKPDNNLDTKKEETDKAVDLMLDKIGPSNPIGRVVKSGEKAFLDALNSDGFLYFSQYI